MEKATLQDGPCHTEELWKRELLESGRDATSKGLDYLLWNRGQQPLLQKGALAPQDANRFLLSVEGLEVATLRGMDEKVDILDSGGEKTGEVAWKSEAHRLGLWHRCFHCWIFSSETLAEGPHLFVQRRTAGKETWPNKLDVTAAGHIGAGEEVLEGGLREIEEELGLRVEPSELVSLGTRRSELEIPAGLDCEFQEVFLLVRTLSPKDLRLQEEEVAAVARLRLDDLEALYGGGQVLAEEWARGEAFTVSVSLADFVPGEDEYLPRVTRAARAYLGSGSPGALS